MKYVVVFHPMGMDRTGKSYVKEKHTSEFATLTQAREHARKFTNASIYRVEWTAGNGWQYIRRLKLARAA